MKTVLNIMGAHCSGKTTAVREYMSHYDNRVETIDAYGWKSPITVLSNNVVVLGRYDQAACGGCDRYKGYDQVRKTIYAVMEKYAPEAIIYEGIIYSTTYRGASITAEMSKKKGYTWKCLFLWRDIPSSLELPEQRNNGKPMSLEMVFSKFDMVERAYRLRSQVYETKRVDVTQKTVVELGELINEAINVGFV